MTAFKPGPKSLSILTPDLSRRARIYGLSTSFVRPRTRTYASFAFGGEIESRDFTTDPDTLLAKLPAIPFPDIRAMRNRIAHHYHRVDFKIVWENAHNDIPPLIAALEAHFAK